LPDRRAEDETDRPASVIPIETGRAQVDYDPETEVMINTARRLPHRSRGSHDRGQVLEG
jgi:hypothetical protein